MQVYILRHGETDHNRKRIVQGSGQNTPLNDHGLKQANAFYEAYKHISFDKIYSSDLIRSQQTIEAFTQHKIPHVCTDLINEISWGIHEGKHANESLQLDFRNTLQAWMHGNYKAAVTGGESAYALSQRLDKFLKQIQAEQYNRVLVCTHGRTLRCLITMMKGLPLHNMEQIIHSNTGLYVAHLNQQNTWKFELENDIEHLGSLAYL